MPWSLVSNIHDTDLGQVHFDIFIYFLAQEFWKYTQKYAVGLSFSVVLNLYLFKLGNIDEFHRTILFIYCYVSYL